MDLRGRATRLHTFTEGFRGRETGLPLFPWARASAKGPCILLQWPRATYFYIGKILRGQMKSRIASANVDNLVARSRISIVGLYNLHIWQPIYPVASYNIETRRRKFYVGVYNRVMGRRLFYAGTHNSIWRLLRATVRPSRFVQELVKSSLQSPGPVSVWDF